MSLPDLNFGLKGALVQVFEQPVALGGGVIYHTAFWQKPRRPDGSLLYAMVQIQCISGGAGAGGGHSGASGVARGGGGGGGGGGIATGIFFLDDLPDILYVWVGRGGPGGAATADGTQGGPSWVALSPNASDASNILIGAAASTAQPGTKGLVTAAGSGGSGATALTVASSTLAQLGIFQSCSGHVGKNGGAHTGAVGVAATFQTSAGVCIGGAGGAGVGTDDVNYAGGGVTAIAGCVLSELASAAPAAGTFPGAGGPPSLPPRYPTFGLPGCGGSSNGTGVGGAGGNGYLGGGGGGGGGGTTGGRGGDGGHGRIRFVHYGMF